MPKLVDHGQRRREMIAAVWDVIAADGIEGVSMRRVAAAAGCTTGRISHYFADREELVLAALRAVHRRANQRMEATVERSGQSARDRLRQVMLDSLPLDDERLREWQVTIAFWSVAAAREDLAQEHAARTEQWQNVVARLIREATDAPPLDVQLLEAMALIDGLGVRMTLMPNSANRWRAQATVDAFVQRLALGVGAANGNPDASEPVR